MKLYPLLFESGGMLSGKDMSYLSVVASGDKVRAQEMLDEKAKSLGWKFPVLHDDLGNLISLTERFQ